MLDFSIMTPSIAIFAVSGFSILALFAAKGIEVGMKRPFFMLGAVKKADTRIRTVHHTALHTYDEWREKVLFFLKKQAPMKIHTSWNRVEAFLKDKREEYLLKMRDARIIKKREGISEFYKNLATAKKEGGEINDILEADFQNAVK